MAPADRTASKPRIILNSFDLAAAEQTLVTAALDITGSTVAAAELLGVPRHTVKRLIIKYRIAFPRTRTEVPACT